MPDVFPFGWWVLSFYFIFDFFDFWLIQEAQDARKRRKDYFENLEKTKHELAQRDMEHDKEIARLQARIAKIQAQGALFE